jgi:hypothetical protein
MLSAEEIDLLNVQFGVDKTWTEERFFIQIAIFLRIQQLDVNELYSKILKHK